MARRLNGEGSRPRKRSDGRWQSNVRVLDTAGAEVRRTVYGRTAKECADKAKALAGNPLRSTKTAKALSSPTLTIGQLIERWLQVIQRNVVDGRLRENTWQTYQRRYVVVIQPRPFAHLRVADIEHTDLHQFYDELRGSGYAAPYVASVHGTIRTCLRWAYREGIVAGLITERVDPRYLVRYRSKGKAMHPDTIVRIFAVLEDHARLAVPQGVPGLMFEAVFKLAIMDGLRWCEIAGLQWGDISLTSGALLVRRSVTKAYKQTKEIFGVGRSMVRLPKTQGSVRQVMISPTALDALRRWAEGRIHPDEGFVFTTAKGTPLSTDWTSRYWHRIQEYAGIPRAEHVRPHDCRHTAATLEEGAGRPKATSDRLGHVRRSEGAQWSMAMTEAYQHLRIEDQAEVVAFKEAILKRAAARIEESA